MEGMPAKAYLDLLIQFTSRDPRPIIDPHGSIFAVLAGMPADPTYKASAASTYETFKAAGESETFKHAECVHRRGRFAALPFGISYGNGQTVPARLRTGGHAELVETLRGDRGLERIASYADGTLGASAIYFYTNS
jgi:hypothetical protein